MGTDKARLPMGEATLVQRVAQQVEPYTSEVFLVAPRDQMYDDLGLTTIGDITPGLGPLGGLITALQHRNKTQGSGWLLLTACDTLLRKPAGLCVLQPPETCDEATPPCRAIAAFDRYWNPMPGSYHTDLIPNVEQLLRDKVFAFQALLNLKEVEAVKIEKHASGLLEAMNLNTLREVEAARMMFDNG